MKRFISALAGGFCILGAALCSGADAALNFEAYREVFGHSLMGIGGLACAVLAFAGAACFSVAMRRGQWTTAGVSLLVAVAAGLASINGTYLRLSAAGGEVEQTLADRMTSFDLAIGQMQRAERALAATDADLAVIRGGDVAATQALMKAKGFYDGQVDGALGPRTERALEAFSRELNTARANANAAFAAAEPIVQRGRPTQAEAPMSDLRALIFAIALTLLGSAGASAGFATISPPSVMRRRRPSQALEETSTIVDLTRRLAHAVG